MKRYIILAEEGERSLIPEVEQSLGCSLQEWEVIITGVGAINVIRSLSPLDRDAELLNIGHAGSANFEIGTLIEVTEVRLNHPCVTYPEPVLKLSPITNHQSPITNHQLPITNHQSPIINHKSPLTQSPCYSNCDFVLQSDYRDCVFDMELAFIAALGFRTLHSIKHVSDNLSLHTYRETASGVAPA
jgi:hypothetical protein